MMPFAAFTAAETPKCFSVRRATSKIVPFSGEISTPSNTWFLGSRRVSLIPNGISIGSAVFSGLTNVTNTHTYIHTDRQTDRQRYSVCSNRPHLAIAAKSISRSKTHSSKQHNYACWGLGGRVVTCWIVLQDDRNRKNYLKL